MASSVLHCSGYMGFAILSHNQGLHNQLLRDFLPLSAITSVIQNRYINQYPAGVYKEPGTIALTMSSHSESAMELTILQKGRLQIRVGKNTALLH